MKTSYLLFAHDNIKSCLHYLPHLCVCVCGWGGCGWGGRGIVCGVSSKDATLWDLPHIS